MIDRACYFARLYEYYLPPGNSDNQHYFQVPQRFASMSYLRHFPNLFYGKSSVLAVTPLRPTWSLHSYYISTLCFCFFYLLFAVASPLAFRPSSSIQPTIFESLFHPNLLSICLLSPHHTQLPSKEGAQLHWHFHLPPLP